MRCDRKVVISLRVPPELYESLQQLVKSLGGSTTSIILARLRPLVPPDVLPDWRYYSRLLRFPEEFEAAVENVIQCRQRNTKSKT